MGDTIQARQDPKKSLSKEEKVRHSTLPRLQKVYTSSLMFHAFTISGKESRMLHLMKEVGSNIGTWAKDAGTTYVSNPVREGNYPRAAVGAAMLPISTILEAPDYIVAGIVDQKLEPPPAVPFGRTRRDLGKLLSDVVHLRPLKSLADAARLAFTDLPLDGIETLGGFQHSGRLSTVRNTTRSNVGSLELGA